MNSNSLPIADLAGTLTETSAEAHDFTAPQFTLGDSGAMDYVNRLPDEDSTDDRGLPWY